jgi:hypothetical protein
LVIQGGASIAPHWVTKFIKNELPNIHFHKKPLLLSVNKRKTQNSEQQKMIYLSVCILSYQKKVQRVVCRPVDTRKSKAVCDMWYFFLAL